MNEKGNRWNNEENVMWKLERTIKIKKYNRTMKKQENVWRKD